MMDSVCSVKGILGIESDASNECSQGCRAYLRNCCCRDICKEKLGDPPREFSGIPCFGEREPCGDALNDDCDAIQGPTGTTTPPIPQTLNKGTVVFGSLYFDSATSFDTDFYKFELTDVPATVTVTLEVSQAPVSFQLFANNCTEMGNVALLDSGTDVMTASILYPDTYFLKVFLNETKECDADGGAKYKFKFDFVRQVP